MAGPSGMAPPGTPGCVVCGMAGPPPDPTCTGGWDHKIGRTAGCPHCERLREACARRPCFGSLREETTARLVRLSRLVRPAGGADR
jgi:hypothetical protein